MRAVSSFGRVRHKIRRFGGNPKAATPCARITPVVALEGVLYFPSGRCGATSKVLEATPVQPRRVRESRLLWCRIRAAPLSGGSVTNPVCWRQLRYDPLMCGNHACRGAWMDTALSRECGANLETLEFAPALPRMRESNDCACRGLDVCCNFFGGCRMTPKHWTHLQCCHAPCEISHRNVSMRTTSLSGGAVRELRRAPVKRTTPLSGGAAPGPCR